MIFPVWRRLSHWQVVGDVSPHCTAIEGKLLPSREVPRNEEKKILTAESIDINGRICRGEGAKKSERVIMPSWPYSHHVQDQKLDLQLPHLTCPLLSTLG